MQSEIIKTSFNKKNEKKIEIDLIPLSRIKSFWKSKVEERYERIDFYQFIHFTAGTGKHFVDFNTYEYSVGTSFYLSKYQVQKWDFTKDYDGYIVLFTENFLSNTEKDRKLLLDLEIALHNSPKLPETSSASIIELLKLLLREFSQPADKVKEEILRSLLKAFLLQLLRFSPMECNLIDKDSDITLFRNFRRYLENHYLTKRTVAEYATKCGVGPKKLNHAIQKFSGITAKQYIDGRIILEAKRLISSTCETTQEAAFALEFDDPSNFVKFFKRYTGVTPSQFMASL